LALSDFASVCGPGKRCPEHLVWPTSLRVGHSADPVSQGSAKLGQEDIGPLKYSARLWPTVRARGFAGAYLTTSGEVVLLIRFKSRRAEYRLAWPYALTANWLRDPRKLSCSVRLSAIRTSVKGDTMLDTGGFGDAPSPGRRLQDDRARAFKEFKKMRVGAVATAKRKK